MSRPLRHAALAERCYGLRHCEQHQSGSEESNVDPIVRMNSWKFCLILVGGTFFFIYHSVYFPVGQTYQTNLECCLFVIGFRVWTLTYVQQQTNKLSVLYLIPYKLVS